MRLWLRARRFLAILLSAALVLGLLAVVGDLTVSTPALGSLRGLALPLAVLSPIVVVVALGWGLTCGDWRLEAISSRGIPWLDAAYVALWALVLALACGAISLLGANQFGYAAARSSIGLAGLLLLGRRAGGGTIGPLVPAVFVLVVAAFGGDFEGQPRWWAWLVADGAEQSSWLLAVGALIAGVIVSVSGRGPLVGHY